MESARRLHPARFGNCDPPRSDRYKTQGESEAGASTPMWATSTPADKSTRAIGKEEWRYVQEVS